MSESRAPWAKFFSTFRLPAAHAEIDGRAAAALEIISGGGGGANYKKPAGGEQLTNGPWKRGIGAVGGMK